jgi:hypothetical protein
MKMNAMEKIILKNMSAMIKKLNKFTLLLLTAILPSRNIN